MTQLESSADGALPSSHGLTPLHLAVLANDYAKVRKIASDREHGIEAPTITGTTAFMLSALYGRTDIFLFLTLKKASPYKKDAQGNNALDYVKQELPFIKDLLQEHKKIAVSKPDRAGRQLIYGVLKARQRDSKAAYAQGRADAGAEPQAQAQLQPAVDTQPDNPQQDLQDPSVRLVFLRSLDGKQQELVEAKQIAVAEHGNIGRKCTAFIYAAGEHDSYKFAVSGWGRAGDKNAVFRNVLNSKEYTELVRRVAALLDFELKSNQFYDQHFPGSPAEKEGAYFACHAEKQLAVAVLIKGLSHAFGTKSLLADNIIQLKTRLDKLPPGLRETTIHLDHEKVCRNCVQFLEILTQKTGLVFRCQSHDWYINGERPQLRQMPDGSCTQVTKATRHSGPKNNAEIIEDEIGILDTDHVAEVSLQSSSVDHEGDSVMVQGDSVNPTMSANRQSGLTRTQLLREPCFWEKRGSPVHEEPKHDGIRYHVPPVTPPSKKTQGLPTPQSDTQLAERPRITISPSPAGASSVFGPQADSMSPCMSQEYEVEDVLQTKEEDGVRLFLVKWKGYPHDTNSWEPEKNLANASEAIGKFWEELRVSQSHSQEDQDAQRPGDPSLLALTATVDNSSSTAA